MVATTLAAAGKEMPKGPKREVLKELVGEREELDGEMVEAEFDSRVFLGQIAGASQE